MPFSSVLLQKMGGWGVELGESLLPLTTCATCQAEPLDLPSQTHDEYIALVNLKVTKRYL